MLGEINVVEMILRSTGAFATLLVLTRIMGKKQISQLTYFNYITGITIGSIAADIAGESETPFWNGLISMLWWTALTVAVGYISLKFLATRKSLDGQPTIIINKGILEEDFLRKSRINLNDLSMMLREKDVFSITEVDYAIMEANGKISVLKKQTQQTPTREDFNLPDKPLRYLPTELIIDGRLMEKNLTALDLSYTWLQNELSGLPPEQVFFAELQADGTLYYQKKHS